MEKGDEQCYWYRRSFTVPETMKGKRLLLHFGAVDWEAKAYVNGKEVGRHTGGYDPFFFDITDAVDPDAAEQELAVYIYDNTGVQGQMTGKQSKNPSICWYTCSSGIWQTVWMEYVPENYIEELITEPELDQKRVRILSGHRIRRLSRSGSRRRASMHRPMRRHGSHPNGRKSRTRKQRVSVIRNQCRRRHPDSSRLRPGRSGLR